MLSKEKTLSKPYLEPSTIIIKSNLGKLMVSFAQGAGNKVVIWDTNWRSQHFILMTSGFAASRVQSEAYMDC